MIRPVSQRSGVSRLLVSFCVSCVGCGLAVLYLCRGWHDDEKVLVGMDE